jgi:pimeloyl-ACP methyl ester carboxylesterase
LKSGERAIIWPFGNNACAVMSNPDVKRMRRTPEQFVAANGITICWDSFGDPADPPLLLIMGMGAQLIAWDDEFCERLAARGFRVIRFDNRDVGRSSWLDHAGMPDVQRAMTRAWLRLPVTAPYLLDDMAADLAGLMDALGIRAAHLVGASMGATIAQTLAIRRPERVLSMTSIMSTTGAPDLPKPRPSAVAAVLRPQPRTLDGYVEQYVDTWNVLRAGRFPEEETRDRRRAARNHARGLNPQGSARHLVAILASGSRRHALRAVSAPTLVIHGDLDPLVPLAAGIDTAESIPGAELIVLEGMGHALSMPLWPRMIDGIVRVASQAT